MDESTKDVPTDVVTPVTWVAPKVAQRAVERKDWLTDRRDRRDLSRQRGSLATKLALAVGSAAKESD
ncbi:hypothetical protein O1611_g5429 [Lasiodiplodia mahajangana]|uniref:Uncharacterized protein n=1 Tax=Lasiodiplodia mahajangana TaxID=1108764 RepID=A0ACC2JLH1_9PEZI|nr:hypothetical protein O1611_g5429 [Lasiodiplodia mahajangana]